MTSWTGNIFAELYHTPTIWAVGSWLQTAPDWPSNYTCANDKVTVHHGPYTYIELLSSPRVSIRFSTILCRMDYEGTMMNNDNKAKVELLKYLNKMRKQHRNNYKYAKQIPAANQFVRELNQRQTLGNSITTEQLKTKYKITNS